MSPLCMSMTHDTMLSSLEGSIMLYSQPRPSSTLTYLRAPQHTARPNHIPGWTKPPYAPSPDHNGDRDSDPSLSSHLHSSWKQFPIFLQRDHWGFTPANCTPAKSDLSHFQRISPEVFLWFCLFYFWKIHEATVRVIINLGLGLNIEYYPLATLSWFSKPWR